MLLPFYQRWRKRVQEQPALTSPSGQFQLQRERYMTVFQIMIETVFVLVTDVLVTL